MAQTFTQVHLQFVFAVKYRQSVIRKEWRDELYKYMTGIVKKHKHKMLQINGTADHVHLLVGMRPTQSMADLMENVKGSPSEWINEKRFLNYKFAWQEGYGVFSYSKDQVPKVTAYIQNQEVHHRKKSFREEYQWMLQRSMGDDYEDRYLFDELIDLGY